MAQPVIHLRQHGSALSCGGAHRSLLDALEAHQVPVEFQCYCGACRLRLLAGEVKYHQEPLAFVGRGEILPCCCLPVDDIELECSPGRKAGGPHFPSGFSITLNVSLSPQRLPLPLTSPSPSASPSSPPTSLPSPTGFSPLPPSPHPQCACRHRAR